MQFDRDRRRVSISVHTFAEFSPGPTATLSHPCDQWRTEVGRIWHQKLQIQSRETGKPCQFEVPVKGVLIHRGWTIELQGRIDQILDNDGNSKQLIEIKTTTQPLPLAVAILRQTYPHYFRQALAYQKLVEISPLCPDHTWQGLVRFVDINSGIIQDVLLTPADQQLFEEQLDSLCHYLEQRWTRWQHLPHRTFTPAFKEPRPEQKIASQQLTAAWQQHQHLLFEAPTGFGKTGTVLELALQQLQAGDIDRVIYATCKKTGQSSIIHHLQTMVGHNEQNYRYLQIHSREENHINSPLHHCEPTGRTCTIDSHKHWPTSGILPEQLYAKSTVTLEKTRTLGEQSGVCPYEILRAALPHADIWLCDVNYIFSPQHHSLFSALADFAPAQTFLIIDEAHNLPHRVCAALSWSSSTIAAEAALSELQPHFPASKLLTAAENWYNLLAKIKPTPQLAPATAADLLEIALTIVEQLQTTALPTDDLSASCIAYWWSLARFTALLVPGTLDTLLWVTAQGEIQATCLDAAPLIADTLNSYARTLTMSATLQPINHHTEACGLALEETSLQQATAPWRDNAYTVAIDLRVDTRLKVRSRFYAITSATVEFLIASSALPVVVYFSSFRYAETLQAYITSTTPHLRIACQSRHRTYEEKATFITEALANHDSLFLVLGSSYAESIDALGGKVDTAMVVGPALPAIDPVAETRRRRYNNAVDSPSGFRAIYQIPGMQKINQALGRLVRSPGQHARVILHGQRFAEPSYYDLLSPEYQTKTTLRDQEDLENWLAQTQKVALT